MKAKAPKKQAAKPAEPPEIVVKYDLFDLPTAFHKAGLAGLVMLVESLRARHILLADECKYALTASTVEITFTEPMMLKLMDDLYDAREIEVAVKSKWQSAETARPPTEAEIEAGTPFIYHVIQPLGVFLREKYPDENGLWLKLWRDMLWNIPRARPTTREPYANERAGEGKQCKEGLNAWASLRKVHAARTKNVFHRGDIS